MLTLILILAQLQISHFIRLHMPLGREWVMTHRQPLKCEGDFIIPASGKYTLHYAALTCEGGVQPPQDYSHRDVPVAPLFSDHYEDVPHKDKDGKTFTVRTYPNGNQEPIYDVDESYDHITVQAKPGTKWWYVITIAVPK